MKTYCGGESAKAGFYFGLKQKDIIDINDSETLPGGTESRYWKIPLILMLFAGPLLGLLYVIFLPFISFAMVTGVLLNKGFLHAKRFAYEMLGSATPAWRPGYSFFSPVRDTEKEEDLPDKPAAPPDQQISADTMGELEDEIAQRRKQGQL